MQTLIILFLLILAGCGQSFDGNSTPTKEKKITSFSFDGVKRIDSGISDGQDPATLTQLIYPVSGSSRLLIRFESLRASKTTVVISKEDDVWLRLTVVDQSQYSLALAKFKICPLIRGDWMTLATWRYAHPFSGGGRWAKEGADYDDHTCVQGESAMAGDPSRETKGDELAIYFKITRWFKDYILGRNVNFGHILISDSATINIYGDASGSYSPRILWSVEN